MDNSRFKFRAFYEGRYIYKDLCDSNYYTSENKCIGIANNLPNDLIWEQCTGLKDKNGKLIYEGDIVTDGKDTGHIFWKEDVGAFAVTMFLFQKRPNELEVIGNIHGLADNKIQAKELDDNKMSSITEYLLKSEE